MFRSIGHFAMAVVAAALLVGCNQAKNPSDVAKDVNSASQTAQERDAKAAEKADAKVADAQKDVNKERRDEQHVAAAQTQNVAETEAEGARKVALAKCEALSGDRQQACKDKAKADYDMRIAQAKQQRAATDPKP